MPIFKAFVKQLPFIVLKKLSIPLNKLSDAYYIPFLAICIEKSPFALARLAH